MEEYWVGRLTEERLEEWFDHLASVFTSTPREYFANHFRFDPWTDLGGIQIAVHLPSNKIASTVRVFLRSMYLEGKMVRVGGIGEVSTKVEHQKKGLAKALLNEARKYMQENGIEWSTLHTSSAAPVYASLGWKSIPRHYFHLPLAKFEL